MGEEGEGRGGGVLMLFLRDRGEGHINPPLTAFLREEIPSFHPAICPSVLAALHLRLSCLHREGVEWVGAQGLFGDTKHCPIHSKPTTEKKEKEKIAPLPPPVVLQSPSQHPLSFCAAVIYSNTISLSSSSSFFFFYSSLRFSNPPHHPPIIFRALS